MKNTRQAFTMIEMIFVIVIIGIVASVAISKLSSTRTDAKISGEIASAKIALNNLGAEFATRDAFIVYTQNDANNAVNCLHYETTNDGNITISMILIVTDSCPQTIFNAVKKLASNNLLTSSGGARTHTFGGSIINR